MISRIGRGLSSATRLSVAIEVVKYDGIYDFTDPEMDYAFLLAKAAGAKAISCELDLTGKGKKRLGPFADKHQLMFGYHGHAKTTPDWVGNAEVASADVGGTVATQSSP